MAIIRDLKNHPDTFVTPKELAQYLGRSERFVQSQIEKGALPARKFGRTYSILIADAQHYVGSTGPTD